jgi:hypothetical protein
MPSALRATCILLLTLLLGGEPVAAQAHSAPLPRWVPTLPTPASAHLTSPPLAGADTETKSHTLTGLVIGGAVGAAVVGVLLATHCSDADPDTQCTGDNLGLFAVFVIPGAVVGAVIGSLIRTKR